MHDNHHSQNLARRITARIPVPPWANNGRFSGNNQSIQQSASTATNNSLGKTSNSESDSSPSLLSRMNLTSGSNPEPSANTSPKRLLDRIGSFTDNDPIPGFAGGHPMVPSNPAEASLENKPRIMVDPHLHPAHRKSDTADKVPSNFHSENAWKSPDRKDSRATCHSSSSEAVVDTLLHHSNTDVDMKDIETSNDDSRLLADSPSIKHDPEPGHESPGTDQSHFSAIDQCRRLLLSLVLHNASQREGSQIVRPSRVEDKVRTLLPDDRCVDFMRMAKELRAQLEARNVRNGENAAKDCESAAGVDPARDVEVHDDEASAKLALRTAHLDGVTSVAVSGIDREATQSAPSSSTIVALPRKPPPTAPKAMVQNQAYPIKRKSPSSLMAERVSPWKKTKLDLEIGRPKQGQGVLLNENIDRQVASTNHARSPPRSHSYAGRVDKPNGTSIPLDHQKFIPSDRKFHKRDGSDLSRSGYSSHPHPSFRPKSYSYPYSDDHDGGSQRYCQSPDDTLRDTVSTPAPAHLTRETAVKNYPPARSHRAVPGLWFAKVGLCEPDIMNVTFEVDSEITERWRLANDSTTRTKPSIFFHLLCLPATRVYSTYQTLGDDPDPATIANALLDIASPWPSGGTLVIDVNHGQSHGRNWFPTDSDLVSCSRLDITGHVRPGTNTVRFIQLADMSEFVFVLHAGEASSTSSDTPMLELDKDSTSSETPGNDKVLDLKLDTYLSRMNVKLKADTESSQTIMVDISQGTDVAIS